MRYFPPLILPVFPFLPLHPPTSHSLLKEQSKWVAKPFRGWGGATTEIKNSGGDGTVPWPGARKDVVGPTPLLLHPPSVLSKNHKFEDGDLGPLVGRMQGWWSRRQVEEFLELNLGLSSFTSPFWNRFGDVHHRVALDFGKLSGPHGDQGKDNRKLAAESWLWWEEAFPERVKVVFSSSTQHGGKRARIWGPGRKSKCLFSLYVPCVVLQSEDSLPVHRLCWRASIQLPNSWLRVEQRGRDHGGHHFETLESTEG